MVERIYLIEVCEKTKDSFEDEDCKAGEALAVESPDGSLEYVVIDSINGSSISSVGHADRIAEAFYGIGAVDTATKEILERSLKLLYKGDYYPTVRDIAEHLGKFFNASIIEARLTAETPWDWEGILQKISIVSTTGLSIW